MIRSLFRAPIFSPLGFVRWAIVTSIPFVIAHLAGLRQYTSILSLTIPEGTPGQLAGFYLIAYVAFTLIAPTLLIAACVYALILRSFASLRMTSSSTLSECLRQVSPDVLVHLRR